MQDTARSWLVTVLIAMATVVAATVVTGCAGGIACIGVMAIGGGFSNGAAGPGQSLLEDVIFCGGLGSLPAALIGTIVGLAASFVRLTWVKALMLALGTIIGAMTGSLPALVLLLMMLNAKGD